MATVKFTTGAHYEARSVVIQELTLLLRDLGVSKYQLAIMLDILPHHVYRWMSGEYRPGSKALTRMMHLARRKASGDLNAEAIRKTVWSNYWERLAEATREAEI